MVQNRIYKQSFVATLKCMEENISPKGVHMYQCDNVWDDIYYNSVVNGLKHSG